METKYIYIYISKCFIQRLCHNGARVHKISMLFLLALHLFNLFLFCFMISRIARARLYENRLLTHHLYISIQFQTERFHFIGG